MKKTSMLTVVCGTAASGLLAAIPAHAGIADGTVNNASILSDITALTTAVNSDIQSIGNDNANTRADGKGNHSSGRHE
ncbi:hypothetical protein AB0G64_26160 [Streptomyces longwoodensis]|uniref:hypothetical protein n=1 Tax=Streptomyces longwoodensis TaxID=68231 RepID=UPI0033E319E9